MTARQFMLDLNGKLIVDLFAGGGVVSLASEDAADFLEANAPWLSVRNAA